MTYFVRFGNTFRLSDESEFKVTTSLPSDTYTIKRDMKGLYLEPVDNLEPFSGKIYGNTLQYRDRIVNTFLIRNNNTGVLLTGEKGSGKTLLAREIALACQKEHNCPIILINSPHCGEEFNTFIQSIDQPCVLLFDEYEKVYEENSERNAILTLMDGVFVGKKLFLMTSNEKHVNYFLLNRPGRIFYNIEFKSLDENFVREYTEDTLNNQEHLQDVVNLTKLVPDFNFDMLAALIEEMNRYNESTKDSLKMLNVSMPERSSTKYDVVSMVKNNKSINPDYKVVQINPFEGQFYIEYHTGKNKDYNEATFFSNQLIDINKETGEFTYENDEEIRLVLVKKQESSYYDWKNAL